MALYVRSFHPPPASFTVAHSSAFSSGTWLQYSSWVSDAVRNDLAHSRIWQERVRKRTNLPFLFLVVVTASTKFVLRRPRPVSSPSAYTDRKREARRIPPPRFEARTRNLFARRQVAYVAMLISVRVSGSSPFLRVLSVVTRYAASLSPTCPPTFASRPLYFPLELPLTLFLFLPLLTNRSIFKRAGLSKYLPWDALSR